jgi:hypothetical protein
MPEGDPSEVQKAFAELERKYPQLLAEAGYNKAKVIFVAGWTAALIRTSAVNVALMDGQI